MTVDVPLINDYKKNFIFRRLVQTFLGGFSLPHTRFFCISFVLQVIVYIIPALVDLLISLTVNETLQKPIICVSNIILFILSTSNFYLFSQRKTNDAPLSEEEELSLILPPKKHKVNIIFHALVSGLYSAWIHPYLKYESLNESFPSYASLIMIFTWFSSLNASFSLLVGNIPETSIFRPLDTYEISSLSRPLFASLIAIPYYAYPVTYAMKTSYVIFSVLPFLWISGMIPTVEPLVLWMGEQIQVHALGGTATSSWHRFIIHATLSLLEFGIVYVVFLKGYPTLTTAFTVASALGFVLSLDIIGMFSCLHLKMKRIISPKIFPQETELRRQSSSLSTKELLVNALLFIGTIGISSMEVSFLKEPRLVDVMGWINVILFCIFNFNNCSDNVYMFFGTIRSPLYCSKSAQLSVKKSQEPLCRIVMKLIKSILTKYMIPLYLLIYVKVLVSTSKEKGEKGSLEDVLYCFGLIRITRTIWQYSGFSLTELTVHYLLSFGGLRDLMGVRLSIPVELLLVGILRDRCVALIKKIYFVAVCSVSSLEERVSKRSYAGCLFQFNIVISPLILLLVTVSSLFQCPLYAFFSLPIFGIAFPRSKRFWPDSPAEASSDNDAIYYEQMTDSFLKSLHSKLNLGKLWSYQPGDHFLARYEDKIVWTTVLECGNGYVYYRVKGTELQHTSCHSLEATRVDDIFRMTFEEDNPSFLNKFAFHSLTPLGIIKVKTYSDTKNVLTGIIEANDTLKLVAEVFLKTLVWYLMKHLKEIQAVKTNSSGLLSGITIKSDSVEAINLESWPPSNESTLVESIRQSAYIKDKNKRSSCDNQDNLDTISDFEVDDLPVTPAKRKGLLPPLLNIQQSGSYKGRSDSNESLTEQLENLFIPGGIENEQLFIRKQLNENITSITPPKTPVKFDSFSNKQVPSPPMEWLHFPSVSSIRREEIWRDIDDEWVFFILNRVFELNESSPPSSLDTYKHVLSGLFASVYESNFDITGLGPSLFVNAFHSAGLGHLALPEALHLRILLPALKTAIKLALDEKILYSNVVQSNDDLLRAIVDIDENWYLGSELDKGWRDSILTQVPHLFSLKGVEGRSTNTLYRSRLLSLEQADVYVGKLNSELVHGLWASLNLELLYLTNDDDERYSIQAEERLLRNLTVQVADPPLGYAIFASAPLRCGNE